MTQFTVTRNIDAPVELVFDTVAKIDNFSKAVPQIVAVEFLSDVKSGVGTRFRETRLMNGKKATTELEVTEYVDNERVRLIADSHGVVWDTVFAVAPSNSGTALEMTMHAKPHKFLPKLMLPLMKVAIRKALVKDMDAVKTYCEKERESE